MGRWRLPECLCLVSRRPFFGMFNNVLAIGQALRLLRTRSSTGGGVGAGEAVWDREWKRSDPSSPGGGAGETGSSRGLDFNSPSPPGGSKLEGLLAQLMAGGVAGRGVPSPGQDLVACGLRFVRPMDEHMSLNDVPVTPLLVSGSRLGLAHTTVYACIEWFRLRCEVVPVLRTSSIIDLCDIYLIACTEICGLILWAVYVVLLKGVAWQNERRF